MSLLKMGYAKIWPERACRFAGCWCWVLPVLDCQVAEKCSKHYRIILPAINLSDFAFECFVRLSASRLSTIFFPAIQLSVNPATRNNRVMLLNHSVTEAR
jgi:hypothetical protein